MDSIRITRKVTNRRVSIVLPDTFDAEEIEILISPLTRKGVGTKPLLSDLLLTGPCISKEEVENLRNTRKWLEGWKVKQFS
jgi:hypothetical protein